MKPSTEDTCEEYQGIKFPAHSHSAAGLEFEKTDGLFLPLKPNKAQFTTYSVTQSDDYDHNMVFQTPAFL